MSDAWLQRLYATIVVGLLVWPVPHYYLTDAIGSDPWKNLGLAMYTTNFDVRVAIRHRTSEGTWSRLRPQDESFEAIKEFVEYRRTRGHLHEPDDLARTLAEVLDTDGLRIFVANQILDGERGVFEIVRHERFEYTLLPDGTLRGGRLESPDDATP